MRLSDGSWASRGTVVVTVEASSWFDWQGNRGTVNVPEGEQLTVCTVQHRGKQGCHLIGKNVQGKSVEVSAKVCAPVPLDEQEGDGRCCE